MPDRSWLGALAGLVGVLVTAAACGGGGNTVKGPPPSAPAGITVTSTAFAADGPIPRVHTCDGADTPPPLTWSGVPPSARSLALLVEDPDAPGGTFVHWTVLAMPATATSVPAGAPEGTNSFGSTGWRGPCPPKGNPHHYRFTVYALRRPLGLGAGASPDDVRAAIRGNAIAEGTLVGTYQRES